MRELLGNENPGPEAPPRSKKGRSNKEVRRGATVKGAMGKGRGVGIIKGHVFEEMTQ